MLLAMLAVFVSTRPCWSSPRVVLPLTLLATGCPPSRLAARAGRSPRSCYARGLRCIVRGLFDAVEAVVERLRLQQSFAGQVSPAVMREMLARSLSPG
jgi:hypothetical protein